jgi:hypothetical protein
MNRNNLIALGANSLVLALLLAGCGDYGDDDDSAATGGAGATPATGGVGAGGAATGGSGAVGAGGSGATGQASCDNVVACGGDVVGTWTASSSCLTLGGTLDVAGLGLGCTTASVTGTLQVSGTWTANGDGSYTDDLTWSGDEVITLPPECLNVSGTTTSCDRVGGALAGVGYIQGLEYTGSITCVDDPVGGGCNCPATVEQAQGADTGNYTVAGTSITTTGGLVFDYCVATNTLTMTPQKWADATSSTTTGTALFTK